MEDKAFLRYALEQSFSHPLITLPERIKIVADSVRPEMLQISDTKFPDIGHFDLSVEQIKKYAQSIPSVVSSRQNKRLYAEYELYKHDLTENIIIPANYSGIKGVGRQLDLQIVNRQSAQKKKITATICA